MFIRFVPGKNLSWSVPNNMHNMAEGSFRLSLALLSLPPSAPKGMQDTKHALSACLVGNHEFEPITFMDLAGSGPGKMRPADPFGCSNLIFLFYRIISYFHVWLLTKFGLS